MRRMLSMLLPVVLALLVPPSSAVAADAAVDRPPGTNTAVDASQMTAVDRATADAVQDGTATDAQMAAAGLCAVHVGHRTWYYSYDGTVSLDSFWGNALSVGIETREWRDCTSGQLSSVDAIVCMHSQRNLSAVKLDGVALRRTSDDFLLTNNNTVHYVNLRNGGTANFCSDTPNRSARTGVQSVYGVYAGAYTAHHPITGAEFNYSIRNWSWDSGGRYTF